MVKNIVPRGPRSIKVIDLFGGAKASTGPRRIKTSGGMTFDIQPPPPFLGLQVRFREKEFENIVRMGRNASDAVTERAHQIAVQNKDTLWFHIKRHWIRQFDENKDKWSSFNRSTKTFDNRVISYNEWKSIVGGYTVSSDLGTAIVPMAQGQPRGLVKSGESFDWLKKQESDNMLIRKSQYGGIRIITPIHKDSEADKAHGELNINPIFLWTNPKAVSGNRVSGRRRNWLTFQRQGVGGTQALADVNAIRQFAKEIGQVAWATAFNEQTSSDAAPVGLTKKPQIIKVLPPGIRRVPEEARPPTGGSPFRGPGGLFVAEKDIQWETRLL